MTTLTTEYIVVVDVKENFVQRVNRKIREGWKVKGGVSITDDFLAQAMIRVSAEPSSVPPS